MGNQLAQMRTAGKAIKDLELMAKKLKKRISILESMDPTKDTSNSGQIALLMSEYRMLKREIVEISAKV